ncbi:MAG: hypothetical protein ACI915_000146 [Gammaproteobacteria bacterium]|jgi:hypothetical protein
MDDSSDQFTKETVLSDLKSVLSKATPRDIRIEPFPHVVIHNALPDNEFAILSQTYPSIETIAGGEPLKNNTLYLKSALDVIDTPAYSQSWRDFFAYHCSREFYSEVIALWQEVLDETHPAIDAQYGKSFADFTCGIRRPGAEENPANKLEDIQLDCQFGVNSPVRKVTSVRGPHVDTRYKLFAALLYFRIEGDDSSGGELEFYRYCDPAMRYRAGQAVDSEFVKKGPFRALNRIESKHVEKTQTLSYEPNTLVMWINSPHAVHGVSPRDVTTSPRRYVNFLGEAYNGVNDGFFVTKKRRASWFAKG